VPELRFMEDLDEVTVDYKRFEYPFRSQGGPGGPVSYGHKGCRFHVHYVAIVSEFTDIVCDPFQEHFRAGAEI
jgi:hypothetical protein